MGEEQWEVIRRRMEEGYYNVTCDIKEIIFGLSEKNKLVEHHLLFPDTFFLQHNLRLTLFRQNNQLIASQEIL